MLLDVGYTLSDVDARITLEGGDIDEIELSHKGVDIPTMIAKFLCSKELVKGEDVVVRKTIKRIDIIFTSQVKE